MNNYEKAIKKVSKMSLTDLESVWRALVTYDPSENYDDGVTMDDWANIVYMELQRKHDERKRAKGKRGYHICEVCGGNTRSVLDGEAWCDNCGRYQ